MPNSREQAEDLLDMAETWRYGKCGSIVSDCPAGCLESGGETEAFYGGHFVCESIGETLAEFIIVAVRRTRFPTRHA